MKQQEDLDLIKRGSSELLLEAELKQKLALGRRQHVLAGDEIAVAVSGVVIGKLYSIALPPAGLAGLGCEGIGRRLGRDIAHLKGPNSVGALSAG